MGSSPEVFESEPDNSYRRTDYRGYCQGVFMSMFQIEGFRIKIRTVRGTSFCNLQRGIGRLIYLVFKESNHRFRSRKVNMGLGFVKNSV